MNFIDFLFISRTSTWIIIASLLIVVVVQLTSSKSIRPELRERQKRQSITEIFKNTPLPPPTASSAPPQDVEPTEAEQQDTEIPERDVDNN